MNIFCAHILVYILKIIIVTPLITYFYWHSDLSDFVFFISLYTCLFRHVYAVYVNSGINCAFCQWSVQGPLFVISIVYNKCTSCLC